MFHVHQLDVSDERVQRPAVTREEVGDVFERGGAGDDVRGEVWREERLVWILLGYKLAEWEVNVPARESRSIRTYH
jgi:hypothetical protein